MDLSIIIVNYNVKNFLRQALISVSKSMQGIDAEVIIVDNDSSDGSVEMIESEFPQFELIKSKINLGFAKANNLALRKSLGQFTLLLNPDTILQEDTLRKCIDFMNKHPKAGALGVKMIDGAGNFLPESKRGFPSPDVAFYKAFGLSKLFPKSKVFNKYHLGYLDEDETHKVDVLSGAFMFIRKEVLEITGLLDEDFFMYGEDIDLSYRITAAGYENYYIPTTNIIHFKGESTKKGSLNYVKVFYRAMMIFANKHFKGKKAFLFRGLMRLGIYFRALMDIVSLFFSKSVLPIFDLVAIFCGLVIFKNFWEIYYFDNPSHFDGSFILYHLFIYSLVWIATIYLYGGYSKKYKIQRIIQGMLFVSLVQLAIYGMLNAHFRPSRMMLIMGTIWSILIMIFNRLWIQFLQHGNLNLGTDKEKRILIVGSVEDVEKAKSILDQSVQKYIYIGSVFPSGQVIPMGFIQTLDNIKNVIDFFDVNEIIWCSGSLKMDSIIKEMIHLKSCIAHKIIPEETKTAIGSESKNSQGEYYSENTHFNLSDPVTKRLKRMWDYNICLILLIGFPFFIFYFSRWSLIFQSIIMIFKGKTWVGYFEDVPIDKLPKIRSGVFHPSRTNVSITDGMKIKQNVFYAKKYNVLLDLKIIFRNLRNIEDY